MSFRLVPKSVTLNDLERRNSRNLCVVSPNSTAVAGQITLKCLKIHRYFLRQIYRPKTTVFTDISLPAILTGITPSEGIKVRHAPLASENLTVTWKRCKIRGKLVQITDRKSYMSFRVVLKSVTLNDLERRNGSHFRPTLLQRIC